MAGLSAHGTVVTRNGVSVENLGNVTPPPLARKVKDVTLRGQDDDVFRVGIRTCGEMQFLIDIVQTNATHDGLIDAWANQTLDAYELTFADGAVWAFNGYVDHIGPSEPVDGKQAAVVTIRPSGGVTFVTATTTLMLLEQGGYILLEDGGRIIL